MGEFFNSWALWQKMTFVLGCGIVATIILGLIKLQYDRYRIRKYSKVDKGKKAQTPEMLESQPLEAPKSKDEVPFGIRAIESGIEVDGVWISRSNTPVGSSRSSINEIKLPRSHNSSQLELPKAAYGSSSRESSRAPSSAFDHAVSAERIPTNESGASSPTREDFYSGRPRIASSSRYSNNAVTRNSMTLQALEGSERGRHSPPNDLHNGQPPSANSGKSSFNSDDSDYMTIPARPYEAAYINPRSPTLAIPVDPRMDLDLLQTHRLSHVAETGQLTPRVRRPGHSGEWASVADNLRAPQEISSANGVDYFVPQQKTPSPPPIMNTLDEVQIPSPTSPMYNQDSHVVNEAKQGLPLLETYAPYQPQAYQPRGPQHQQPYEEEPSPYNVQATPNQHQDSRILRKVNSGFEILRPGTFGEPPSPEDESPESSEKRHSKRLQKKRRSSNASRPSHFVEQV